MVAREPGGRLADGRFELLDRLGSGGMGTVWRARDVRLDREVALKEVRPADPTLYEDNPELAAQLRARVLRESRALARLQHPNVVSIYQILDLDDSDYPWIVMELVRGGSLQDRLDHGPLAPHEAGRIGRDVLNALRAAHAAGIRHRDVKPANILLRVDDTAVLTDFGIAALHDATCLTTTGAIIGSPEYIAPERLRGAEGDPASDLWSLAMLLYVAVEGHHPLRRANTMATLAAIMTEPVPPPRQAGALTPALTAVLVTNPAARPAAERFEQLLAAATDGHAPTTAPLPAIPANPATPTLLTVEPPAPSPAGASRSTRVARRLGATVLAAVVLWIAWTLLRDVTTTDAGTGGTRSGGSSGESGGNLLTPDGAREAVAALSEVIGSTKVAEFDLDPDSASAVAPAKEVANAFDYYVYRDGVASRERATTERDLPLIDLNKVNWDALPKLLKRADDDLGIEAPTLRWVVVTTDRIEEKPEMTVFLMDDYGAAFVDANLRGRVVKVSPRD